MREIRNILIHLDHCRGIGWKTIYTLLKNDPNLSSIYNLTQNQLENILPISSSKIKIFLNDLHSDKIHSILKQYNEKQIHTITIIDDQYPQLLKSIYDPPWVLYAKGDLTLLKHKQKLSIVGTRSPTNYGINSLKKIITPLVKRNWAIVSGLALGIDSYSHQITVNQSGKTIAVLGSGVEAIYPSANQSLADTLARHHLLLSEYPPNVKAQKWHFPMRNRIISGLSYGTLVIEAKERSGSFITADQALSQGREVFAIPGSIFNQTSVGTNRLIQSGAKLVIDFEDILTELTEMIS